MYTEKQIEKEVKKTEDNIFSKYDYELAECKQELNQGIIEETDYQSKREELETKKLEELSNARTLTLNKLYWPEKWE